MGMRPTCVHRCAAAAGKSSFAFGGGVAIWPKLESPGILARSLSKAMPSMLPNPSLHPTCYRGLRPLSQAGELKR
jgi:hypothetical protein